MGRILAQKPLFFVPNTAKRQVLPFLGFFGVRFLLRRVFVEGLGNELRDLYWSSFLYGSGCAFLLGFTYLNPGVLVFFAVLGTLGPLFRVPFSFFSPLSPSSFPPFSSWGRLGFSSLLPCLRTTSIERSVPSRTGGRDFRCRSGSLICLDLLGLGHPCRTLDGIPGYALSACPGSFRFFPELLPESPSRTGVWPINCSEQWGQPLASAL